MLLIAKGKSQLTRIVTGPDLGTDRFLYSDRLIYSVLQDIDGRERKSQGLLHFLCCNNYSIILLLLLLLFIIIIIVFFITVFAGVLFVHHSSANHAPEASVTQVNHSVRSWKNARVR